MKGWDQAPAGWRTIGAYCSLPQARRAVDGLAGERFPVHRITIVACAVPPPSRLGNGAGYGWAAVSGLLLGAPVSAILGLLVALLVLAEPLSAALTVAAWAALAGALVGLVAGVGTQILRVAPDRDAATDAGTSADRYDLLADPEVADLARAILDRLGRPGGR